LIIDNHIPYHSSPQYLEWGGGIGCQGESNPTIVNNLIVSNSCANDSEGGGIYFVGGKPIIINNTLSENTGGGITFFTIDYTDSFVISNNIIANSTSGLRQDNCVNSVLGISWG
jgi:hypothetical protein